MVLPEEQSQESVQIDVRAGILTEHPDIDKTLAWLIQNCDVSVRLHNCVVANPEISALSIREVICDKNRTDRILFSTRNVGRKTATELFALCESIVANGIAQLQESKLTETEPQGLASQKLLQQLTEVPFPESILQQDISIRLRNIFENVDTDHIKKASAGSEKSNLCQIVCEWAEYSRTFLTRANCGRVTLKELEAKIVETINATLSLRYGTSIVPPVTSITSIINKSLNPVLVNVLLDGAISPAPNLPLGSPKELILEALRKLAPRELDVIQRRYGLAGTDFETLEEIGSIYNVTRERIRQLESKAFRRLAHGVQGRKLKQSIELNYDLLWNRLGKSTGVVFQDELGEAKRQLASEEILAIDVIFGSVRNWLNLTAACDDSCWSFSSQVREKYASAVAELQNKFKKQAFPYPLFALQREGFDEHVLENAARILGWRIHRGYVFDRIIGARTRRAVALHLLLTRRWPLNLSIFDIVREYHDQQTADQCSVRDAEIVMQDAKHLFLRVTEDRWSAITQAADVDAQSAEENPLAEEEPLVDDEVIAEAAWDLDQESMSIAAVLERILNSAGPLRFSELRQIVKKNGLGEMSMTSIGPILLTSGRFVRIAPGMWALPSQVNAVASGETIAPGMLDEDQCRWFVIGMRAGCEHGEYVAWNQRLELELCRWAETHAPAILFEALLAIIKPERWLASDGDVDYWTRMKALKGSFRLALETPELIAVNSPVERLLAAGQKIVADGTINWVLINKVCFTRVDSTVTASALAILVAAGVLRPAKHWQDLHRRGERAVEFISALASKLSRDGQLSWSDAEGRDELEACRLRMADCDLGWVPMPEIERLISELFRENRSPVAVESEEIYDPLESLLAKRKENKRKQLLEKLTGQIGDQQSGQGLIENIQPRNLDE